MMYSEKLVVAIKVNGRILRENGDTVVLPFGCEYSILVKNLNSVRAQISVSVDGKEATSGTRLIVAPNSSLELERFIRNGNLQAGNKFKFIERSADIEKHRGIGEDDGLIRVEGWREHVPIYLPVPIPRYYDDPYPVPRPYYPPYPPYPPRPMWRGQPTLRGSGLRGQARATGRASMNTTSASIGAMRPTMDSVRASGITVPGGESRQQFNSVRGFALEPQSVVIVLRLRGEIDGNPVEVPLTVDAKPTCSTCGKANKASSQFCSACGTALELI